MGVASGWDLEALLDPYWLHVFYFVGSSILGFFLLQLSQTRSQQYLNQLDAFFTSVSAATVTSLGSVRMQELSEFQLGILTILMLVGGEIFTSTLCLHLKRLLTPHKKHIPESEPQPTEVRMDIFGDENLNSSNKFSQIEGSDQLITDVDDATETNTTKCDQIEQACNHHKYKETEATNKEMYNSENIVEEDLKNRAILVLSYITLVYLLVVQLVAILVLILCFLFSPVRQNILDTRGIKMSTFCVFTTVSSFANGGFIPLDDNFLPFRKDTVFLITVALQVLLGNTMYAPCLRAIIWTLWRLSRLDGPNRRLYEYILRDGSMKQLYRYLFPTSLSVWLVITVVGFLTAQILLFCALQWNSEVLEGLNTWEKLVVAGFQSVAIRTAGEAVVDPQLLSLAVIFLYMVMMYLPSYPVYYMAEREEDVMEVNSSVSKKRGAEHRCKQVHGCHANKRSIGVQLEKLLFQDSCYLIIAVIVICITERESISQDPLNYTIGNIVFEVVSAYGNVGMSIGYSCSLFRKLTINSEGHCEQVAYSFSGKWSSKGKMVIILVMFIGRLKGIKRNSYIFSNTTAEICRYIHKQLKIIKVAIHPSALRFTDHVYDPFINRRIQDLIKRAFVFLAHK